MFNNIILKINILSFMTGIRHTDVKDFFKKNTDSKCLISNNGYLYVTM